MARRGARIEQSRREVERCDQAFRAWLARRRAADAAGQYASQLDAVEYVMDENLGLMRGELEAIPLAASVPDIYGVCEKVDRQLVWVRRLWDYFREKWDQRDDPERRPVLAAADEIVWSCYAPPFRQLQRPVGPAPLPYIATEFSPHAIPRRQLPQYLRPSDELLMRALDELPVSVVGIPQICIANPWWLVLIPHEVGHQVAFELDGGRLPATVGALAADAAARAGGAALADDEWSAWAQELFADAFAGTMVGAAHLWALNELETGEGEALVQRVPGYPPPIVRRAVTAELLRCSGLPDSEALPAVPAAPALEELKIGGADRERVERQLGAVGAVAQALAEEPIVEKSSLRELLPLRVDQVSRSGRSGQWRKELAGAAEARPEPLLEAARLATAGALAEWAETMAEPDQERRLARTDRLRQRMLEVVPNCREPGKRAAREGAGAGIAELARELAREANALPLEEPVWSAEPAPTPDGVWVA